MACVLATHATLEAAECITFLPLTNSLTETGAPHRAKTAEEAIFFVNELKILKQGKENRRRLT